jgi:hypothetical protein
VAVDLTPEQEDLLEAILRKWRSAETTHKRHRKDWDRWDALYHSRRDLLQAHASASPRDRDMVLDDARKEFGADLLIPYAFSVVETVLPRLLSNRPRMLFTPRNEESARNVANVRDVMDAQQHKANYELKLQTTGRSGLIYGLGVQHLAWRREEADRKRLVPRVLGNIDGRGEWAEESYRQVVWDDPDVQDVSPYDFLWDPYGACMNTVGYVFHRTWRSTEYVLAKVARGDWGSKVGGVDLEREDLEGGEGKARYVELWKPRWNAQGNRIDLKEHIHEVWQFHDGRRVVTIVNQKWPVALAENPAWHGRMPFHIYRPTEVLHAFCGKSEIEPMEDLQHEMNMLRTDRRWNALMKLHQSYFYDEGTVDPDEIKIGPGTLNPVNAGGVPLRDLLHPVSVGDIPNSSYQEEAALQADIERVTGISDPVSGASTGAEQTATGVQLVQAAAGLRIQAKTRRIELELIKPSAEDWLALNQQRIREEREIVVPASPEPGNPERRWAWRKIGPQQLQGEFDVVPDGGSTAPDNVPQMRQDAQMLQQLMGLPGVDPRKVLPLVIEKLGIKAPETLLMPEVHVPPQTLDILAEQLAQVMPAEVVNQLIEGALNAALAQEEGGPAAASPEQAPSEPGQPPEQAVA